MYKKFAYVYDSLVDVNYNELLDIINENVKEGSTILDLACGTGTMINLLSQAGYNMIGADISEEMLEIARGKNPDSRLFVHDLKEDFFIEPLDAITCSVDSMNYLLNIHEVENLIKNVSKNLEWGTFIFDVHSESKLNTLNDYIHVDLDEDLSYIWKVDVIDNYLNHYLTFFVNDEGLYERFDEEHVQKVYKEEEYQNLLTKYGFTFECKYLEDRIVFICNK
ncbi:class I SAM-dependent methyltransferase [Mycoplasmatota bacterium WC44]